MGAAAVIGASACRPSSGSTHASYTGLRWSGTVGLDDPVDRLARRDAGNGLDVPALLDLPQVAVHAHDVHRPLAEVALHDGGHVPQIEVSDRAVVHDLDVGAAALHVPAIPEGRGIAPPAHD